MMKSPHSEAKVAAILKQVESGASVRKVCCEHDISSVTFYRWRRNARNAAARAAAPRPSEELGPMQTSQGKIEHAPSRPANTKVAETAAV